MSQQMLRSEKIRSINAPMNNAELYFSKPFTHYTLDESPGFSLRNRRPLIELEHKLPSQTIKVLA